MQRVCGLLRTGLTGLAAAEGCQGSCQSSQGIRLASSRGVATLAAMFPLLVGTTGSLLCGQPVRWPALCSLRSTLAGCQVSHGRGAASVSSVGRLYPRSTLLGSSTELCHLQGMSESNWKRLAWC